MLSSFIDYHSLNLSEVLFSIAQKSEAVLSKFGYLPYIGLLHIFTYDAHKYFYDERLLPIQTYLAQDGNLTILQLTALNTSSAMSGLSLLEKDLHGREVNDKTTVKYTVVGLSVQSSALNTLEVLNRAKNCDNLFAVPITKYLTNFYWQKYRKWLHILLLVHLIPLSLLTCFTATYTEEPQNGLLIPLLASVCPYLILEVIEAVSDIGGYIVDVWNWIDIGFIASHFTMLALIWTDAPQSAQRLFISFALLFSYTKLLSLLRVRSDIRYLIRMLIEILRDSLSFMAVSSIYLFAFAMIFYQSRLVDGTNEQNSDYHLLEAYTLYFGDWDVSHYSAIALPFFVLVTLLLTLIMLNMLIAIMGDTFDRIQDSIEVVNGREKLAITTDIVAVRHNLGLVLSVVKSLCLSCLGLCRCRNRCDSKELSSSINTDIIDSNIAAAGASPSSQTYLMVVEPFRAEDGSDESNGWNGRVKELKKMLSSNQQQIQQEFEKLKEERKEAKKQVKEQQGQFQEHREQLKQLKQQLEEQQGEQLKQHKQQSDEQSEQLKQQLEQQLKQQLEEQLKQQLEQQLKQQLGEHREEQLKEQRDEFQKLRDLILANKPE